MFLEIVLHIAQCTSHAAAKYSSSAKNWLHCKAIKVKYYPLLPNPQTNTAAGEGQQKNDVMKPKRESKHHASSMRGSATAPGQRLASLRLTSVLSLSLEDFFEGSYKAWVCYTQQLTAERSIPLLLLKSWWQMVHNILTTLLRGSHLHVNEQ